MPQTREKEGREGESEGEVKTVIRSEPTCGKSPSLAIERFKRKLSLVFLELKFGFGDFSFDFISGDSGFLQVSKFCCVQALQKFSSKMKLISFGRYPER